MQMLRWMGCMCGNTMKDEIKNKEFREKLGVAPLSAKKDGRLFYEKDRKHHNGE